MDEISVRMMFFLAGALLGMILGGFVVAGLDEDE